jgi:hypothetical protein
MPIGWQTDVGKRLYLDHEHRICQRRFGYGRSGALEDGWQQQGGEKDTWQ